MPTAKNCCPSEFSSQMKAKRHWLALSTGKPKNALHKSITENNLLPLRVKNNKALRINNSLFLEGLGQPYTLVFIGFSLGKIVVFQGLVQGIMRP